MTPDEGFEPARRELCPDGSCIGLVGADGRCKVCGTVSPSAVADPRRQGMLVPADGENEGEAADDDRELCADGGCIGLIGEDDRCNVCGRIREAPPLHVWKTDGGADGPPGVADEEDDDSRELCPDGGCIGLIGPDGRCKVCGLARGSAAG